MVNIILPISRTEYLRPVFNCLDKLERPADTELLIITDGDNKLQRAVDKRLDYINYKRIKVINFGDTPAEGIDNRRYRIAAIHNKAGHYVSENCDHVFLIEDDTTYPPDALNKMLKQFQDDNCAYVEGVELGRWKTPYIGAWKVDNLLDPNEIISVMPSHGIQNIDAGGLYCALTDAAMYRMHNFEPFDKQGKVGLSCDVNFGLYLRRHGFDCYLDHSIQCDHIGEKGSVNLGNTIPRQVRFSKTSRGWWGETL